MLFYLNKMLMMKIPLISPTIYLYLCIVLWLHEHLKYFRIYLMELYEQPTMEMVQ